MRRYKAIHSKAEVVYEAEYDFEAIEIGVENQSRYGKLIEVYKLDEEYRVRERIYRLISGRRKLKKRMLGIERGGKRERKEEEVFAVASKERELQRKEEKTVELPEWPSLGFQAKQGLEEKTIIKKN